MSEEIKPAEVAGEKPQEPKVEEPKEQVDYKTQYEQELARRQKAESVIQRHKKPKEDEPDDEPNDPDEVRNVIREELDAFKSTISSQLRGKEISDALARFSSNPQETELIRYHYENSIRQTGDVELDMENAKALANKRKVQTQLEEMKASIASKENRSPGSPTGQKVSQEPDDDTLPSMTDVDRKNVDWLREKYVLSNKAIRQILKGERLDDLLSKGVIKKR